jgi:hypothetical protein
MPTVASNNAAAAKMPSNHIINRAWPSACATTFSIEMRAK